MRRSTRVLHLLDLVPEHRDREGAQRDEVRDAHAAGEQQHGEHQRVQHRHREVRLERREHVEHADDDEEREHALRRGGGADRPSSRSASTSRRRRRACRTPTAGRSCRRGSGASRSRAARCSRAARDRAAGVTIVIHMIGHAQSRKRSASSLAAMANATIPAPDAGELARDVVPALLVALHRVDRARAVQHGEAEGEQQRHHEHEPARLGAHAPADRAPARRRAPARAWASQRCSRGSAGERRGESLELAAALLVVVEHVVAGAGG